ncbi:MAG: DUF2520 domain-containing protein [Chromatiales bacterium]|nr:DUF2520 domain-containing protein [Chromatiales bacterium]
MSNKPTFSLIGAGAAGTALALALSRQGYRATAIASRSQASAEHCATLVDCDISTTDPLFAARSADIVIIATPDGQIKGVCDKIAETGGFSVQQTVIHLSGAAGASVLGSAKNAGAATLSFHPIQTLSDPQKGAELLIGAYYCLEGDQRAIEQIEPLVSDLQGTALIIDEKNKALYHAALCVASNYLVVLEDIAVRFLEQAGIERESALKALLPLVQGGVDNLRHSGLPQALTGPISRGDSSTISVHLQAMEKMPERSVLLYKLLGQEAIELAQQKGNISPAAAESIQAMLSTE